MKPKRRRIQLDRGDTLGGTVPLLMRDDVLASELTGRSLKREREAAGLFGRGFWLKLAIAVAIAAWFLIPNAGPAIGLPTPSDVWTWITALFADQTPV